MATISAHQLHLLIGGIDLPAPRYRSLADRIALLAEDGRLQHGDRMPSERDLAATLGVSRVTVGGAYRSLTETGHLRPRQGSGHYLDLPTRRVDSIWVPGGQQGVLGLNAATLSAAPGVAAAFRGATEDLGELLAGTGYWPDGIPALRRSLAGWYTRRGLATDPDQILVTNGAQAGLNLVLDLLLRRGDRVLVESPGYCNAFDAIRNHGGRLQALPVTPAGWQLDALDGLEPPAMAYLVPDHSNPIGVLVDSGQRTDLIRRLRDTTVVIDETTAHLPLEPGRPEPPMASLSPTAITLGSSSKTFWGGLRLGWIRARRPVIEALLRRRSSVDMGSPPLEQLALTRLVDQIDGPDQVAHLERIRSQRDHLAAELHRQWPELDFDLPAGGLGLWTRLPAARSTQLTLAARQRGLALISGRRFLPTGGGERQLRLPYGLEPAQLTEAVTRLVAAWAEVESGRPLTQRPDPVAV